MTGEPAAAVACPLVAVPLRRPAATLGAWTPVVLSRSGRGTGRGPGAARSW